MKESAERKRLKELYLPPQEFVLIDVPEMQFVMIDGAGTPGSEDYRHAVKWLFTAIYPIKRIAKDRMGKNFVEPPLEALYWADDMDDFVAGKKDRWKWRVMIVTADWVNDGMLEEGIATAAKRFGEAPRSLRLEKLHEGKSVQIMHVGPPQQAAPIVERLHCEFLPANNLKPNGHHHEIYLTDPSRVSAEKSKMVFRQPVQ